MEFISVLSRLWYLTTFRRAKLYSVRARCMNGALLEKYWQKKSEVPGEKCPGLGLKLGLQDERLTTTAFVLARLKIDFIPHGKRTASAG